MPSVAKVFSHHITSFNSLTSLFSTTWLRLKRSSPSGFSASGSDHRPQKNPDNLPFYVLSDESSRTGSRQSMSIDDAPNSLRSNMDKVMQQPLSYELNNLKSVNTFIHASTKKKLPLAEDDRIHLKQEIWQAHKWRLFSKWRCWTGGWWIEREEKMSGKELIRMYGEKSFFWLVIMED